MSPTWLFITDIFNDQGNKGEKLAKRKSHFVENLQQDSISQEMFLIRPTTSPFLGGNFRSKEWKAVLLHATIAVLKQDIGLI